MARVLNKQLVLILLTVSLNSSFLYPGMGFLRKLDTLEMVVKSVLNDCMTNPNLEVLTELWTRLRPGWEWRYGWGWLGKLIGFLAGWPLADRVGRKQGLIYSNIFRIIAVCVHFIGIFVSWMFYNGSYCKITGCIGVIDYFNCAVNLSEELHSGLAALLGILYIYEISPKSSYNSSVESASVLAVYFGLGTAFELILAWILPELRTNPINYLAWISNGFVSLTVAVFQSWILSKYFPESPSFLAIQQAKVFESKAALEKLRPKEGTVSKELHEIQRDYETPRGLRRTAYLVEVFIVYLAFHWILTVLTLYQIRFHVSLTIMVNAYVLGLIISYLTAAIHFSTGSSVTIDTLRKDLFISYFALASIYFLMALLCLVGNFWKPELIREYSLGLLEIISCLLFWKYPGIITVLLVCEYSNQKSRGSRIVLGWVFGGFIAFVGFLAFAVTGTVAMIMVMGVKLLTYLMIGYPWIWLAVETGRVWRADTRKDQQGGLSRRVIGGESSGSRGGIEGHSVS